jgi:hypothetical protein
MPMPPRPPATRQPRLPAMSCKPGSTAWTPSGEWLRAADRARAHRGVRRGAGAGPGADRHLPVRPDPGLRLVALDTAIPLAIVVAAAAGASACCRPVLPAVPHAQPGPVPSEVSLLANLPSCAGSRSPPGRWPRSRSAPAGMLIRRVVPAMAATLAVTPGSPRKGHTCASTTDAAGHQEPQPAASSVDHHRWTKRIRRSVSPR